MAYLTDSASSLFVVIGMRVRNNLDQEQQRKKRKKERQRFEESARERMRDRLHFRASCKEPRVNWSFFQVEKDPPKSLREESGDCKRIFLLEAIWEGTACSDYWAKADGLLLSRAPRFWTIWLQILRTSSSVGFLDNSNLTIGM